MIDEEEDKNGDWMKIAHTAIITKLIQCLAEWEEIHIYTAFKSREIKGSGNGKTSWQSVDWSEGITQRELWLAKGVVD